MSSKVIGKLLMNDALLQKDLDTIAQLPVLEEAYPEFGVGSWKNHSLWNKTGDYRDMQVCDSSTPAQATEFGKQLPYIQQLIDETFDTTHLRMVRSRNLVNGFVFPHRDFVELSKNKNQYLRVFIPLETNQSAYHSDEHSVFQMQKNEIWHLDASIIHSAANFSTNTRVNICLDFQFTDTVPPIESIFLNPETAKTLNQPTEPVRSDLKNLDALLHDLAQKINHENLLETLVMLSKFHFQHQVGIADCYDWLIMIAEKSGSDTLLAKTKRLKTFMIDKRALGEQFSFQEH